MKGPGQRRRYPRRVVLHRGNALALNQKLHERARVVEGLAPGQHVKELVVQNKMGIHARPAAMIVRITNKFKADVFVEKDEEQVNGKSIMGLMMLAAGKGSKVKFLATGEDAPQMLVELEQIRRGLSRYPRRHKYKKRRSVWVAFFIFRLSCPFVCFVG